jgi:hypothetical protein
VTAVSLRIQPLNSLLTARSGLVAVNQLLRRYAHLPQILDQTFPLRGGHADGAVALSYIALLAQGITEFDATEAMRRDPGFAHLLELAAIPSAPTVRQRIEARGKEWLEPLFEANRQLLWRAGPGLTPVETGHVPLDIDVFVMDNSDSRKEGVGRTYLGVDGYAPIAAYLGGEGYLLELSLRPGTQHSVNETPYTLERVLPLARQLTREPLLVRMDSGFDSARLVKELRTQREALKQVDWIIKWNPRRYDVQDDYRELVRDEFRQWTELRRGKRVTLYRQQHGDQIRVMRLTEETMDRNGQALLLPKLSVEGWWTTLDTISNARIIALYEDHGTHEQFHAEIKSEMGLERLPSGKFEANDTVLSLAVLAYNALRLIGQTALTHAAAPVRHPARRRRLKTVIREFICAPGQWIQHARQLVLGIPTVWAGFQTFVDTVAAFQYQPVPH